MILFVQILKRFSKSKQIWLTLSYWTYLLYYHCTAVFFVEFLYDFDKIGINVIQDFVQYPKVNTFLEFMKTWWSIFQ